MPAPAPAAGAGYNEYPHQDAAYVIFTSESEDKGSLRRRFAEVNAIVPPVPQYMLWAEKDVAFGLRDHPPLMPNPGTYSLVVDSTLISECFSCRFSRVLIDGGSNINILYRDTLAKLGIRES